jgi:hypothetical protein
VRAFSPSASPAFMNAFVGNAVGILGSLVGAALTVMAAWAALRDMRAAERRGGQPVRSVELV